MTEISGMSAEELIERLRAFADDPAVATHNRIRALEVVHRIQRDEKLAAAPQQRKRDELARRRLAKAAKAAK